MRTWLLIVGFTLVSGWFLARAARLGPAPARGADGVSSGVNWAGLVDALCHAAMSAGMGVMVWDMVR